MRQQRARSCNTLLLVAWISCFAASGIIEAQDKGMAPDEIRRFYEAQGKTVLTFMGYSGSGYQDPQAMLTIARRVLEDFDPAKTLVNSGATRVGIGAVYELARDMGFQTSGIVSSQAREQGAELSPAVDRVFFVADETWGGFLPGTAQLSPTSTAIVENSDILVAIGGGAVARDEILAAQKLGKEARFYPAEMNHQRAIDKAARKGLPTPTDFRGAVGRVFEAQ
jgi:predicted Rossmann-fold nucleotide-binding protein